MSSAEKGKEASETLDKEVRVLDKMMKGYSREPWPLTREKLARWKLRVSTVLQNDVHPREADRFNRLPDPADLGFAAVAAERAKDYRAFLLALRDELLSHPDAVLGEGSETDAPTSPAESGPKTASTAVFVIHGHDEINVLRLEKLIKERWHLSPIVLRDEPGRGRALIEKFEEEASKAAYAFALFTSDDLVEVAGTRYFQARPNVLIELGWFYGRIGRDGVCILYKKGTKIPSDLDGITRVEFNESVDESIAQIEAELKAAGLL